MLREEASVFVSSTCSPDLRIGPGGLYTSVAAVYRGPRPPDGLCHAPSRMESRSITTVTAQIGTSVGTYQVLTEAPHLLISKNYSALCGGRSHCQIRFRQRLRIVTRCGTERLTPQP
jgi:hypothetical protein